MRTTPTLITLFNNIKHNTLLNWYNSITKFFIIIFLLFFKKQETQKKTIKPVIYSQIELDKKYIKKQYSQFLNMISYKIEDQLNNAKLNSNIDPLFYKKNTYEELLEIENSELEKQWKTRILFENTSRGNIIMFFDIYKLGFSYYSDNTIQYNILNAVAMKYVRIFNCFDYFMDTQLNDCSPSPLIILKELIDTTSQTKKMDETTESSEIIKTKNSFKTYKNAFAKLKNYSQQPLIQSNNTKKNTIEKTIITEPETFTNKFMCLGKIANFNLLKRSVKKNNSLVFSKRSQFEDMLSKENSVQKKCMSYKDYKQK